MLNIKEYIRAESLEQAYELNQRAGSVLLGGMHWLNLQNKKVSSAIDLSGLHLDNITETREEFRIGAMVTLRQIEQHGGLSDYTGGALKEALRSIVGVQFRNGATLGGSIFPRFGFSDVLTAFLAMDTRVELYRDGEMTLEEFAETGHKGDILVSVVVKKEPLRMKYLSQRNTATDFPTLTCAVSSNGDIVKCVVGARPRRAVCFRDEENILAGGITKESADAFGAYVRERVGAGSNMRAGSGYRKQVTEVLVRRGLLALAEEEK